MRDVTGGAARASYVAGVVFTEMFDRHRRRCSCRCVCFHRETIGNFSNDVECIYGGADQT